MRRRSFATIARRLRYAWEAARGSKRYAWLASGVAISVGALVPSDRQGRPDQQVLLGQPALLVPVVPAGLLGLVVPLGLRASQARLDLQVRVLLERPDLAALLEPQDQRDQVEWER